MKPILILIEPFRKGPNTRVTVRVGDGGSAEAFGVGGQEWEPAIITRPVRSIELFDADMTGRTRAGQARFTLKLSSILAQLDSMKLDWQGAPVQIWSADDLQWPGELLFKGLVDTARMDLEAMTLGIDAQVSTKLLETNLLTEEFTGGGGPLEGDPAKQGTLKPSGFGVVEYVEPVWFDEVDNIGMLDGYGNLVSVDKLMEGASDLADGFVADYATYALLKAAIVAGTVGRGQWGTSLADGCVGLGAPPAGVIGANCTFGSEKPGDMMLAMIERAGVDIEDLDLVDVDTFDAVTTQIETLIGEETEVGYWTKDQVQVRERLEAIAGSINASVILGFDGKISVTRGVVSSPVATLDRSGSSSPNVTAWRSADTISPFYELKARTARPARLLARSEVLFDVPLGEPLGDYDDEATYRRGDMVYDQGSTWLYINDTPGAGNEPPTLPTETNAHWRVMARAGPPGVGTPGANAKTLYVISNRQQISYNGAGAISPASQPITFTIVPQNLTTGTYTVSLTDQNGVVRNVNTYVTSVGGTFTASGNNGILAGTVTMTMTAANFDVARNGTNGIILTVAHADGPLDKISVLQSEDGTPGANAKTLYLTSTRQIITLDSTGTPVPASQTSTFAVNPQNLSSGTFTISMTDQSGNTVNANSYLTAGVGALLTPSGNNAILTGGLTFNMTVGNFNIARGATNGVIVRADHIDGPFDIISIGKSQDGGAGGAGTNAKVIVVESDRIAFTFDGAGTLDPPSQSATITATPTNFTGGAVVWTWADNLGTASATLAALMGTPSANVRTMPSSVFTATPARVWVRATATGQGAEAALSDATTLYRLEDGSNVLTVILTNETHTIPTDSDGNAGDFSGANGLAVVFWGATNVTAAANFAELSETNVTGDVNTATNTPVGGQPRGYYRVTALSALTGTYKIRVTYNPGSGVITQDKDFTLSKSRAGVDGLNNATVRLVTRNFTGVAPAAPSTTTTYTFATSVLSGTLGVWAQALQSEANGPYIFETTAPASSDGPTDTILAGEWSTVRLTTQSGEDLTGSVLYDPWTYTDLPEALRKYTNYSGSGEGGFIVDLDMPGGRAFEIGNNSGNDQLWLIGTDMIAYDASALYEITWLVDRNAGSGFAAIGAAGRASDRTTLVNANGANDFGAQYSVGLSLGVPGLDMQSYHGYLSGRSGSPSSFPSNDPLNPGKAHTNVAFLSFFGIFNYLGAAGRQAVGFSRIRKLEKLPEWRQGGSAIVLLDRYAKQYGSTDFAGVVYETIASASGKSISAIIPSPTTKFEIGLTDEASPAAGAQTKWSIRGNGDGQIDLYKNGVLTNDNVTTYTAGTRVKVVYDLVYLRFIKDEANIIAPDGTPITGALRGKVRLGAGSHLTDITPGGDVIGGTPGANGYTLPPAQIVDIAVTANYVPKAGELPKTIEFFLRQGAIDLTLDGGTTFSWAGPVGVTSSLGGANNSVLTVSAMAANTPVSGTLTISRSGEGVVGIIPIAFKKTRDGQAGSAQSDTTLTVNNTASYIGSPQGGVILLTVGPGTIQCDVNHQYQTAGSSAAMAGTIYYRTTPGSGSWIAIGTEEQDPFGSLPGEPSALTFQRNVSGPVSTEVWEFKYENRRYTGAGTVSNQIGGITVFAVTGTGS